MKCIYAYPSQDVLIFFSASCICDIYKFGLHFILLLSCVCIYSMKRNTFINFFLNLKLMDATSSDIFNLCKNAHTSTYREYIKCGCGCRIVEVDKGAWWDAKTAGFSFHLIKLLTMRQILT